MIGTPNQILLDNDIKEYEMDIHFSSSPYVLGAGIAHSVTGWTTEVSEFKSR
jgi:hypothetical protein